MVVIAPLLYLGKEEFHTSLRLYCASIAPSKRALIDLYCGGYCAPIVFGKEEFHILLRLYCASIALSKRALIDLYCGGYCAPIVFGKRGILYFIVPLLRLYCA